jgi:hypothetical protein
MKLTAGWWLSPGTPVSSTNTTDRHDITKILLKVALNTMKTNKQNLSNQTKIVYYNFKFDNYLTFKIIVLLL